MYAKPTVDKEARLRRKLVNNELNPIADAILTLVLLSVSPFIWMFAQIHDKLMFKFLNKTYIYNVSWEVSENGHEYSARIFPNCSICAMNRILAWITACST